ncbi:predicted protein [Streptomyces viridosporus ATCC 14672]|uniref:Predicted protein n=1 Tax=Streptomyces viridosporus (strain ATCC 14672 / DSM 40746 / JCM 4963 / KCTC 9882 / NRRL B-12104 / FH 1290) TaxID=566461 RepID=D6A6Z0_STRV1|nr:predicted protein [Streptomyces viridosporus ATCC 14672]
MELGPLSRCLGMTFHTHDRLFTGRVRERTLHRIGGPPAPHSVIILGSSRLRLFSPGSPA